MRVVVQRVSDASVSVENKIVGAIKHGVLVFLGIMNEDKQEDIEWICKKLINLRIFDDSEGQMNLCLNDIDGDVLLVSQFTLYASTKKGNRPSYIKAAKPDVAIPIYEQFVKHLEQELGKTVAKGVFGAHMDVRLNNDGPVTIIMDSKDKQ